MPVPLLDLKRQNSALETGLKVAFERVLRSGYFILGKEVEQLEKAVANYVGTRYAIGVSSGTDALLLALMALEIGPGDEVLCPTFTFFATAGCIARTGATPVFVDACPVCFNLDMADAGRKVTSRTKAIIPVHLFGQAAEMDGVMKLARRHHLTVIEDAAQALGAAYKEHKVGSIGIFGAFSFFPSKNLGGFGDAGMLVTDDPKLANKARLLRTHGARPKYYHKWVGGNFRIDALQAALLQVKLPYLDHYIGGRRQNAAYYTDSLSQIPGVVIARPKDGRCPIERTTEAIDDKAKLILPIEHSHNRHSWNQYTARVLGEGRRDALRVYLQERGIGSEIYYPKTMDQQECFAQIGKGRETIAVAHQLSRECLSIPVYPGLNRKQKEEVVSAFAKFLDF